MEYIRLSGGRCTLVDDDLYNFINQFSWMCDTNGYACRSIVRPDGKKEKMLMHHLVMGKKPEDGYYTDHINGETLDNRRANLRFVTKSQNAKNFAGWDKKISSKYKGVFPRESRKKWRAIITCDRKRYHLGDFSQEIDAAKAYNEAAERLFGEFARLNKI